MKAPIALAVLAAALTPAWASSIDPVSPARVLSRDDCHPVIGMVTSVHVDSFRFGTDIVLHGKEGTDGEEGKFIATIPAGSVKRFPALDAYVGQKVAIWGHVGESKANVTHGIEVQTAPQLQLLSTALADPKKTWCYLSPIQRDGGACFAGFRSCDRGGP
jgi:hypothetical protein